GAGVGVDDAKTRVVEGAPVNLRQVGSAGGDGLGVDVDHHDLLDGSVAQRFPGGGAFAAAGDEDAARGRMGDEGRVDQRLVVDELVGLAGLDLLVQEEAASVGDGVDDLQRLEAGLKLHDRRGDELERGQLPATL